MKCAVSRLKLVFCAGDIDDVGWINNNGLVDRWRVGGDEVVLDDIGKFVFCTAPFVALLERQRM